MAGREDHVVLRDALEAAPRRLDEVARRVDRPTAAAARCLRPRARAESSPRTAASRLPPSSRPAVSFCASTVGIQTILQPERPASSTATGFKPPTLWFSVRAPNTRLPGTALRDHLRALAGLDVVGFQDEPLHAAREKLLRAVDVVDAPGNHVRSDVNLQIVARLPTPSTPDRISGWVLRSMSLGS